MIITTYLSESVALLNDEPVWNGGVSLEASTVTHKTRSLGGREARRGLGDSLRLSLEWVSALPTSKLNALRDSLQSLADKPVLCPLWPFKLAGAGWSGSRYSSGLEIGWMKDWSSYEIGAPVASPASWDFVAPLLRGVLDTAPQPDLPAHTLGKVRFAFIEDSAADYALVPDAVTFLNGPALADATTPKIFPFHKIWQSAPSSGGAEFEIERNRLGPSRTRAAAYYTQVAERPQAASVFLTSAAEIAEFLRWLLDRNFSAGAHYVATAPIATRLSIAAAAGTSSITLTDADDIGTNRFLALTDGRTTEIVRVLSIAGDVCTLSANLTNSWTASHTMVNLAMLARHAGDSVHIEFKTPTVATAKIGWREVSAEYTVAAGETRGTTLGKLVTEADLYTVTLDFNGATEIHRFTSFERDLTVSGNVFTSRVCEHTDIRETLNLDRDELTLTIRWWADCPFRKLLPNKLDCRLLLVIQRCEVSGATGSGATTQFTGEITGGTADGPMLQLAAAGDNALFDRQFPKLLMQPGCNHALFDNGCALLRADWTISATVYSISGKTLTLENFTRSGGLPSGFGFAHWFALGYVSRTIGGLPVRQIIFDSAAMASSRIALTLGSVPTWTPVFGDAVTVIPHCDGLAATCQAYNVTTNPTGKFNNYPHFLGFPFMPDKNPAFTPLRKTDSTTGKK